MTDNIFPVTATDRLFRDPCPPLAPRCGVWGARTAPVFSEKLDLPSDVISINFGSSFLSLEPVKLYVYTTASIYGFVTLP